MLIVLLDPSLPSCQRFLKQNVNLPCRKWNVHHPVVKRQLQRSPQARAIESLPTLIEFDPDTRVVNWYTHEQAFLHAQSIQQQLMNSNVRDNLPPIPDMNNNIGMEEVLHVPPHSVLVETSVSPIDPDSSAPPPLQQEMYTDDSQYQEAKRNRPKEMTPAEIASKMAAEREQMFDQRPQVAAGIVPPPPDMNEGVHNNGQNSSVSNRAVLGAHEIMMQASRPKDPASLGMEPGQ